MEEIKITDDIHFIGVNDYTIDLFENQFVVPNGMSYNSYLIEDEKIAILDTVDKRKTEEWIQNVEKVLKGRNPDYLIISHLEPDHSANIKLLAEKYPMMQLVGNTMTFKMLPQFFEDIKDLENRKVVVKEGDELSLGKHTLQFFMAPMVHWPEVMVTYEKKEKILFTADGFGKFGTMDTKEDWACEARRYYFGIVGKYGMQVQALLKKVATLDVQIICPLHGPILQENLAYYINKYDIWSSYQPEDEGVLVAYASIHGNTEEAALQMAKILEEKGAKKVVISNLVRDDMSEAVEDAFRYDRLVLAASSYNAEVFPPMEQFLSKLKARNYQKRKVAMIENGTWAPSAAKCMKNFLDGMKDITLCEKLVTIQSTLKHKNIAEIQELADEILKK